MNIRKRLPSLEALNLLVPKAGLEPARRATTLDFESSASANSATSACVMSSTIDILPLCFNNVKGFLRSIFKKQEISINSP